MFPCSIYYEKNPSGNCTWWRGVEALTLGRIQRRVLSHHPQHSLHWPSNWTLRLESCYNYRPCGGLETCKILEHWKPNGHPGNHDRVSGPKEVTVCLEMMLSSLWLPGQIRRGRAGTTEFLTFVLIGTFQCSPRESSLRRPNHPSFYSLLWLMSQKIYRTFSANAMSIHSISLTLLSEHKSLYITWCWRICCQSDLWFWILHYRPLPKRKKKSQLLLYLKYFNDFSFL